MYPWISRTLDFWLQFCEKKCGLYMDVYGTSESDYDIIAGEKAAELACKYVDWLLSTVNPTPPDEGM